MRIGTPDNNAQIGHTIEKELENFIRQPTDKTLRVCNGCTLLCSCSQSPTCTCNCSSSCPNAGNFLSSDPEYPIEPNIVPLVYALKSMRSYVPCWSCEGHNDYAGNLSRLPRVWFYSASPFYPRILVEYLEHLRQKKKIQNPWQLSVISPTTDHYNLTFSLEPNLTLENATQLSSLRQDINVIAESMDISLRQAAHSYLGRISGSL